MVGEACLTKELVIKMLSQCYFFNEEKCKIFQIRLEALNILKGLTIYHGNTIVAVQSVLFCICLF